MSSFRVYESAISSTSVNMCVLLRPWRQRRQCVHDITDSQKHTRTYVNSIVLRQLVIGPGPDTYCSSDVITARRRNCLFSLLFSHLLAHKHTDVKQPWPHHRPESQLCFYVFTLIMKPDKRLMIDWSQAIFKGWWWFRKRHTNTLTQGRETNRSWSRQAGVSCPRSPEFGTV